MIRNIFLITLFSLLTFSFNANSAEVKFGTTIISSAEIEAGIDPKKKKITVKNAEVKFDDGSIYNGPIKKNKISGKGKLTLNDGTVYEGKFKSNKFVNKISKNSRTYIKLNLKKGINVQNQMKVKGLTKWYPADLANDGEFKLSKKGELMVSQDKKAAAGGGDSGGSGC